ncbi:oligoendopeptidase, M3 family [Hathewaya proteolytica DSM 3090]|uniref:Oligoendopeptidase, M3 family n=1 Tax=Hathewaya proteolytica DSM 3090 TaxID=1121331 RepID=A0A1M6JLJ6_9CLOT|nr:M3 family oligoendopeptidase [Hathewaya proteolytica]SHJ47571.1 oligoendopeptidase, M3 family [Hathewaya proteolytica DSM 3090]
MKFKDFEYVRPNMASAEEKIHSAMEAFKNAKNKEEQINIIEEVKEIRSKVETAYCLVSIRNSINTVDPFYEGEMAFMDENMPSYSNVISEFYRATLSSEFRKDLEEEYGKQFFTLAENEVKTINEDILEDLKEENRLSTEYTKLKASAKIIFEGEERNLMGVEAFMESDDRDMRKKAYDAWAGFFEENEEKFDTLYDKLVKVRDKIAKKLGYENFIDLGYIRMQRIGYNKDMVANFRNEVLKYIVPAAVKVKERQAKRLGLDSLKYYDDAYEFKTGNPIPKGSPEWLIENANKMYSELSKETGEFFNFMVENELLDLVSKKGKAGGGFCEFLSQYKSPFIFANFNGTSGDINILTHEAGHAFQAYRSRNVKCLEYAFPTSESAEIHSMSMEFLTWPWMNVFFKEDGDKYKYLHLASALTFIPYGVTVDEFQHFVYENPEVTPAERKAKWREIQKKYMPWLDYSENEGLERGVYWFKQSHIFQLPFYYIDYCLAQVCALQFWVKADENREKAWNDYLNLCDVGGSKPFLELLEIANLKNPFKEGCVDEVVRKADEYLAGIDDTKF